MNDTPEANAEHRPAEASNDSRHTRPVGVPNDPRQKSPFLAGLLSVMPGLGQVYVGYYQRGFVHALVVAVLMSVASAGDLEALTPLVAIFLSFFWLYNVIDAARRASLYNQALAGIGEIDLPEDFKVPGFRGSVLGGVLIAATGFVLLLHTRFDYSLDWIEEWWPAALIGFGVYLVWKAWQDRPALERSSVESVE